MENLKDKLSRGFKRGSKFLVAAELLHRIVDKNEPIRPSLLLQLLNRAHKEVYFYIKEKLCAWCGREAISFKSENHKREYHQTGFCQSCQAKTKRGVKLDDKRKRRSKIFQRLA